MNRQELSVSCYRGPSASEEMPNLTLTLQESNDLGSLTTAFVQHHPGESEMELDAYYREAKALELRCVVGFETRKLEILHLLRLGPILYELTLRSDPVKGGG